MRDRVRARATRALSAVELGENETVSDIIVGLAKIYCDNVKMMRVRSTAFVRTENINFPVKSCSKAASFT